MKRQTKGPIPSNYPVPIQPLKVRELIFPYSEEAPSLSTLIEECSIPPVKHSCLRAGKLGRIGSVANLFRKKKQ